MPPLRRSRFQNASLAISPKIFCYSLTTPIVLYTYLVFVSFPEVAMRGTPPKSTENSHPHPHRTTVHVPHPSIHSSYQPFHPFHVFLSASTPIPIHLTSPWLSPQVWQTWSRTCLVTRLVTQRTRAMKLRWTPRRTFLVRSQAKTRSQRCVDDGLACVTHMQDKKMKVHGSRMQWSITMCCVHRCAWGGGRCTTQPRQATWRCFAPCLT